MRNQLTVILSYPRTLVEKERRMKDAEPVYSHLFLSQEPGGEGEKDEGCGTSLRVSYLILGPWWRRKEGWRIWIQFTLIFSYPSNLVEKEKRMEDTDPVYGHLLWRLWRNIRSYKTCIFIIGF